MAGHLKGQALQEWNLLEDSDKVGWQEAAKVLQSRLEHGNRTMAAQEFQHLRQGTTENVSEFIRQLERTFRIAHGKGMMATESREEDGVNAVHVGTGPRCVKVAIQGVPMHVWCS